MCICTHARENQRRSSIVAPQISSTYMGAYTHAYMLFEGFAPAAGPLGCREAA